MIKLSHGAVAEWLRRGLQNLVHRFNSGRRLQNPDGFCRSPNGGIGIRVRLKIEWRNPYGFKSHFGHHYLVMINKKNLKTNLKRFIPLIFIIGIFVFICSFMVNRAVWFDESYSAQTIKGTFSEIAKTTGADVHPPLYYYLLKIWTIPFGRSIISLRSFSVFFGIIAIIFAYLIFKRWSKSPKIAGFITLAVAVCPFFIYYATEIRMYSLVCAIVMASVYVLDLALEEKSQKYWLIYSLLLALALYTHYFAAFAFLAEYIYVFIFHRKNDQKVVKELILVSVLAFILFLPWIPSLISQVTAVEKEYWIEAFTPLTFLQFFSLSLVYFEDILKNIPELVLVVVAVILIVIAAVSALKTMGNHTKDKTALIAFLVFIPFLALFILSVPPLSPVYVPRYITYSLTLFWALVAILIVQIYNSRPFLAKLTIFIMLICSIVGVLNVLNENNYSAVVSDVIAGIETYDGEEEAPIIFAESSSSAFDAVFYQTKKHHVYIIDPMTAWGASKPLSEYGENYIEDFDAFKKETETFWYVSPTHITSSRIKQEMTGFKLEYAKNISGYAVYKFQKEKDLKTSENLL